MEKKRGNSGEISGVLAVLSGVLGLNNSGLRECSGASVAQIRVVGMRTMDTSVLHNGAC